MTPADKPEVLFVRTLLCALCTKPEHVFVESNVDDRGVLIKATVDASDLGRVIGKGGENAQAIRLLLRTLGSIHDARYGFKIDSEA